MEAEWLRAREAAAFLGVKLATLYAYKSRGWIESVPVPGGRGRRYARDSLLRLKARHDARSGHSVAAAGALRFGEPSLETSVSEIREDGPYYRGLSALALCERGVRFEAVVDLLLEGTLREDATWSTRVPGLQLSAAELSRADVAPSTRLAALVSALSVRDPARHGASEREEHERSRRLICLLAQSVTVRRTQRTAAGSVAERLAWGLGARLSSQGHAVLDRALSLCADHEQNASTFVARVTASTGADLYACLGAAFHALSGPRHGGASAQVEALLREIPQPAQAARVLRERFARGERLPGFGHPLYPQGDPRGRMLLALAAEVSRQSRHVSPEYAKLRALCAAVRKAGQPEPNLDAGLVAVCSALGLRPRAAAAVFAIGRIPGWVAHALEQRRQPYVLRPRSRYVSP